MKDSMPPILMMRFFRFFCDPELVKYVEGDLIELYQYNRKTKSKWQANWIFFWEIIKLIRPSIMKSIEGNQKLNYYGMFKHNLKLAFRSFSRDKSYAWINLAGLTLGVTVSLMILQYVTLETSYDNFHSDIAHKYRVVQTSFRNDEINFLSTQTPYRFGSEAGEKIAGIKDVVRIRQLFSDERVVISAQNNTKKFMEYGLWYVDKSFLDMFSFPLISGDRHSALEQQNSIVITQETAEKYFGNRNPIGETMKVHGGSISGDFVVKGILEDLPPNTHMKFDFLLPMDFLLTHYGQYVRGDGWGWTNFHTYLTLEEHADKAHIAKQMEAMLFEHWGKEMEQGGESLQIHFQHLKDIHLKTSFANDLDYQNNSEQTIRFLSFIAMIILVIVWINYVNLSTARAVKRTKEVWIRKTIGAMKGQLIFQFLSESLLFSLLAFGLALLISYILTPYMGSLIGKKLIFFQLFNTDFWVVSITVITVGSVLSGLYPSFIASRFSPLGMLKANKQSMPMGGTVFQRSLIMFQLIVSFLLISGTYLIYEQVTFMKEKELGIPMDQILVIHGPRVIIDEGRELIPIKHKSFKNMLLENTHIHSICGTSNIPGTGEIWWGGMRKLGNPKDHEKDGRAILVDQDFTKTYQFEFIAGQPFQPGMEDYEAVIINEEAVKAFDLNSPLEAIGQSIIMSDIDTLRIQGVFRNVHWNNVRETIAPTIYGIVGEFNAYLSIKVNTENISQTLAFIEDTFREVYPTDPYKSFFLNEEFNKQYSEEEQFSQIFFISTIVVLGVSLFGLFALVSYALSLRVKEIGIRKVLGATLSNLTFLLSKEYLWLMILASVISIPLFIWGAEKWLQNYAYHITLNASLFLFPLVSLLFIVCVSIGYRIYSAATANPAASLKDD